MTKITKDIIIETAYQLFFKHGYNNVQSTIFVKNVKSQNQLFIPI